jgi:hypothetical protein
MRPTLPLLLVTMLALGACGEVAPTPSVVAGTPVAAETTPIMPCPERPFDRSVTLGPEFQQDVFVHDESEAIARDWVAGLTEVYARSPQADPCRLFTARGLATARDADSR